MCFPYRALHKCALTADRTRVYSPHSIHTTPVGQASKVDLENNLFPPHRHCCALFHVTLQGSYNDIHTHKHTHTHTHTAGMIGWRWFFNITFASLVRRLRARAPPQSERPPGFQSSISPSPSSMLNFRRRSCFSFGGNYNRNGSPANYS